MFEANVKNPATGGDTLSLISGFWSLLTKFIFLIFVKKI